MTDNFNEQVQNNLEPMQIVLPSTSATTSITTTTIQPSSPTSVVDVIKNAELQQRKPLDIENDPRSESMDTEAKVRYELYLQTKVDNLIRFDISIQLFNNMSQWQRIDFLDGLLQNTTIKTIHISGYNLHTIYTSEQLYELFINCIGKLQNLQELFIFKSNCILLNDDVLAQCISNATKLKVLMLWQFTKLNSNGGGIKNNTSSNLVASLRMHPSLERITINLPFNFNAQYGCLDLYCIALSGMKNLKVLQIRCDDKKLQNETLVSVDALLLLLNSTSIESLYLENIGLLDDHIDALCDELINNTTTTNTKLKSLDLKNNLFTDDVLYTFGTMFSTNKTKITSLDISGCTITTQGGIALSTGILHKNYTVTHLDIEGIYDMYKDEFNIPDGYKYTDWMQNINYQLRLNRSYTEPLVSSRNCLLYCNTINPTHYYSCERFVSAITNVNDHISCIYELIRSTTNIVFHHIM